MKRADQRVICAPQYTPFTRREIRRRINAGLYPCPGRNLRAWFLNEAAEVQAGGDWAQYADHVRYLISRSREARRPRLP